MNLSLWTCPACRAANAIGRATCGACHAPRQAVAVPVLGQERQEAASTGSARPTGGRTSREQAAHKVSRKVLDATERPRGEFLISQMPRKAQ